MDVRLPNGMIVRGVPDDITKEQLLAKLRANGYKDEDLLTPAAPPTEEESGFFRQAADIPIQFATGVATGVRLISDAFGADNPVSQGIRGVENWLQDLLSAQAKRDQQEIARIMKEVEDAGVTDQVVGALKAFTTAPLDFISQAAGTVAPTLVGGLAAAALRAPAVVGLVGTGATMGAGTTKSAIYDATYEALRESGASEEEAREKASAAQEYGGENLDQILIGTVIGGAAGRIGVEAPLAKQLAGEITKRSIAKTAAGEAGTEFVQAGQEQLAANIAQQREGFDVPTMRGVVGAGTLEALAGAGLGAAAEFARGRAEPVAPDLTTEDVAPSPPAPPVTPPPVTQEAAPPAPPVEGLPSWLQQEVDSIESTSQAANAIVNLESELGNIAEALGTPDLLVQTAQEKGVDPAVFEARLRDAADELQIRLPAYREKLNQLRFESDQEARAEREAIQTYEREQAAAAPPVTPVTPPAVAPAAPMAQIPQTAEAQQQLFANTDPNLLKALNIEPPAPPTPAAPQAMPPGAAQPAAPPTGPIPPAMQEAPSVPTAPTPPITPPVGIEPTGGSVPLSVPTPAATGPEADQPSVAGLDVAERGAPDVVARTERVEPALKAPIETAPAPSPLPDVPTLREDATDAEVREYYEALRKRDEALGVKPTPRVKGRKKKDLEFQQGPVPGAEVLQVPEVEAAVQETIKGWTNAPSIVVAASQSDVKIPEDVRTRITPNTRSVYDPSTATVYVLSDRVADKPTLRGTIYHETLGHFGLRQQFGDRLDAILSDIYNTNPQVKKLADQLRDARPDLDTPARLVQEVLAIKSEAGPIKEAGIRAAFNRVAAFIRRIGRAVGLKVAYSNNDVAQVIAQAQDRVIRGKPATSVQERIQRDRDDINAPADEVLDLEPLSPQQASAFRKAMSDLSRSPAGENVRKLAYGFMSMQELADAFKKTVPSLQGLLNVLNGRAFKLKERRLGLEDNVLKWANAIKKHPKQVDKFYSIALESTRLQIEFDNPEFNNHSLTREFRQLHPDLQKVYRELVASYTKMADEYIALVTKNLPDTAANKIRQQFEERRLKVYLPLYREGDYWMRYQDKGGDTVVQAFPNARARDLAWREALKEGAVPSSYQPYTKVDQLYEGTQPGGGFYSGVMEELNKYYDGQVPEAIKQPLYELFLDTIPASSVRQQFRKREGYKGADRNLLSVYATVGTRMETQLNNLEFGPMIEEARSVVNEDMAKAAAEDDASILALRETLDAQMDFLRNPTNSTLVNLGVFASYADYILGNISSALANVTQLPMTVFPMLSGEYGMAKAQAAMENATRMYFNGGWDNRSDEADGEIVKRWPADRTIFDRSKIPANSPMGRLFDAAFRQNVLKHSTAYDLLEARGQSNTLTEGFLPSLTGANSYLGFWNKSKQVLGWTFQNTERFNREVTLVAAFELAMEKGRAQGKTGRELEEFAINKALRLTNETHGVALTEVGPRFFQTGPLKVALTFKNFARTQYFLQYRLLKDAIKGMEIDTTGMSPEDKARADAENAEFRKIAVKQWLGVLGGAFTFAGVQGLPFYGAGLVLASLANAAFGDDDELLDPDEQIKQARGSLIYKGPMNQLLGVDIAARTGFNGMLWREDPKRLAEIGGVLYTLEQVMGPLYGSVRSRYEAVQDFNDGYMDRALEKTMPVFVRNLLKTYRYSQEGVLNKDKDRKIVDDLSDYEMFMQAVGFAPTEVSETYATAGARKELELKFLARRTALMHAAYLAYVEQSPESWQEAMEAIRKHNDSDVAKNFNKFIDDDSLLRSFRERERRARESMGGLSYNKNLAPGLKEMIKD